jgi:hypothetical protein
VPQAQTTIGIIHLYLMESDTPEHSFRKDIKIVRIAILALLLLLVGTKFGFEISILHFLFAIVIATVMYLVLEKVFNVISPRNFNRG